MCLDNTLKEERLRFDRLAVKLQDADNARAQRVANAIVSVLSKRTWEAYSPANYHKSEKYKESIEVMRRKLIPKLPKQVQYKIFY